MSLPGLSHALPVSMLVVGGFAATVTVAVVAFTYFEPHFRQYRHEGDTAGLDWGNRQAVNEFRRTSPTWAAADRTDARLTMLLKSAAGIAVLCAVLFVGASAAHANQFRGQVEHALQTSFGATVDPTSRTALPSEPGDVSPLVLLRVSGQPKSCTVGAGESVRVLRVECDGKPLPVHLTIRQR